MAGDWIKIEKSTARKPEVLAIAEFMQIHPDHALGLCVRFWSWCDDNMSRSCHALVTSLSSINHAIGSQNFAEALHAAGWVTCENGSINIPRFDRHLSESAKTRALATERKRDERSRKCHDANVTETGLEKRRVLAKASVLKPSGGKSKATLEEIEGFAQSIGLPKSDGEATFYKWEGNGWRNGSNPVKDWKATIRAWKAAGYMPSQKANIPKNKADDKKSKEFQENLTPRKL